jgi:hypothetical protein
MQKINVAKMAPLMQGAASMGPRHEGRGNARHKKCAKEPIGSFNTEGWYPKSP